MKIIEDHEPRIFLNELASQERVQPKKETLIKTSVSSDFFLRICGLLHLIVHW